MIRAHIGVIVVLCTAWGTSSLCAADFATYRGLKFGMKLAAVEKVAGTQPTDVKLVHQRPALIQELDWQPRPVVPAKADPVKDALLCFYNGELFRIVVNYDRYKIEGMTEDDMIEGISAIYGAATRPVGDIAYHSIYGETAPVIARWENSEYSYNLIRTGDRAFAMVLYSKRLDPLAQAAILDAVRLETQEAPQRELASEKKREDEARLVLEKARSVNKPNFRP